MARACDSGGLSDAKLGGVVVTLRDGDSRRAPGWPSGTNVRNDAAHWTSTWDRASGIGGCEAAMEKYTAGVVESSHATTTTMVQARAGPVSKSETELRLERRSAAN